MDLLGGAYDSDSEDESSGTPATSSNIAAPKAVPKPAADTTDKTTSGGSGKKRKVFSLGSLPTKDKPTKKRNIFANAGKDLDSDTPALAKQAEAAKSGVLRQQNFDDGTLLGALRSAVPEVSGKQKSQGPTGTLDVPKPSDLKKQEKKKKREEASEFLTSIGQQEDVSSDEEDGELFNLQSNKKELEKEAERQLLEEQSSPENDVGPIRPSDWSDANLNQAFPDADDTLEKLMQSNQKLSDEEKRALAMGSNVVDFDPSQLQDTDWRRKQLAAELPGEAKVRRRAEDHSNNAVFG